MPTDKYTETDRALKLRGLLSDESVIDMLPDDLDSISEIEKMDLQNQANIEKNLENMSKMGQDTTNAQLNTNQEVQDKKTTENQEVKSEIKQENIKQSNIITK